MHKNIISVVGITILFLGTCITPSVAIDTVQKTPVPISDGNTLYVGGTGPGNYTKIQDAIDNGSDGDTVYVYNGIYYEDVVIDKSINLIGEDKDTTIIDGIDLDQYESIVSIVVDWVNISGFTIQNIGGDFVDAGIKIISNHVIVTGNKITSRGSNSICLESSSNNIITDNNITKSGSIYLHSSSDNIITNNNITNSSIISLRGSSGTKISGNKMVGSRSGIFIKSNKLEHWNTQDIDTSNTVNGKPIIYWKNQIGGTIPAGAGQVILANCTNLVVENQNISVDGVGIGLGFTSGCTITGNNIFSTIDIVSIWLESSNGNNITNNIGHSIHLSGSDDNNIISNEWAFIDLCYHSYSNIITGNTITNSYGIYIYYYSDNNIITGNNIFSTNQDGIYIDLSDSNTVKNNNITNNYKYGIRLCGESNNIVDNNITNNGGYGIGVGGDSNTISGNNISNNENGIYIEGVKDNIITDNNITKNIKCGIYIQLANGNIIKGNTISDNQYGIKCPDNKDSYNNIFYHNNFIDNIYNAYDEGRNIWNDRKYGNYWDDYKERYPNAKPNKFKPWIWNTPYEIEGGDNKDKCPLINQWPKSRTRTSLITTTTIHPIVYWFLERFPLLERLLGLFRTE